MYIVETNNVYVYLGFQDLHEFERTKRNRIICDTCTYLCRYICVSQNVYVPMYVYVSVIPFLYVSFAEGKQYICTYICTYMGIVQ
jgi:hypothetical protein